MKGKFIAIEGLDGSGKTTQAALLTKRLEQDGNIAVNTAEPTSRPTGKLIRSILSGEVQVSKTTLAALFCADRIEHNQNPEDGIIRLLNEGKIVISDRYYYSSIAYQGSDCDMEWVARINTENPYIIRPDLCVFLTMEPELGIRRITESRDAAGMEIYETLEYQRSIRKSFEKAFSLLNGRDNVVFIDASGTIPEVAEEIYSTVKNVL